MAGKVLDIDIPIIRAAKKEQSPTRNLGGLWEEVQRKQPSPTQPRKNNLKSPEQVKDLLEEAMKELSSQNAPEKRLNENYVDPRIQKQMAALIDGGYAIRIDLMSGASVRFKIVSQETPDKTQSGLGRIIIGRSDR